MYVCESISINGDLNTVDFTGESSIVGGSHDCVCLAYAFVVGGCMSWFCNVKWQECVCMYVCIYLSIYVRHQYQHL